MSRDKILHVEDDPITHRSTFEFLTQNQFIVNDELVDTFEAGIEWVKFFNPDVILMDIQLTSGMYDGIRLAEEIHRNYTIPIIFLSVIKDRQIRRSIKAKPHNYLLKSGKLDKEQILATIESALINRYQKPLDKNFKWRLGITVKSDLEPFTHLFIPFDDIYMFRTARERIKVGSEIKNRKVNKIEIVTATNEFLFTASLTQILSELPDFFVQANQSEIVNMKEMTKKEGNVVFLEKINKKVTISREYKSKFNRMTSRKYVRPSLFRRK